MASDSLLWGEGLFLRPHHFQRMEAQAQDALSLASRWTTPFHYGIHRMQLDPDSLANWKVSLASLHLRLQDGTQLRAPEDCHLPAAAIPRDAFRNSESRIKVYVGISELRRGSNNTGDIGSTGTTRFVAHEEEVEDENRAGNPQTLQFRKLNPRILIGDDAARGYDALPVMQLKLGASAEAPPQIDPDYIPPLLAQDAWAPLAAFIRSVADRLGSMAGQQSQQMIDRGVAFASGHKEDLERILHLHAVNCALGGVGWLPTTRNLHPFVLYTELCRAVGQLAIFRGTRRIPELPVYDHDNLALCFNALRKLLEIEAGAEDPYRRIPFAAQGLQMSVRLESEWLAPSWSFYIGVESTLKTTRVTELLSEKELGMKAGSTEEVDNIYRFGRRGVRFVPVGDPPRAFPRLNWHYFRVDRDEAWSVVERSLNLGIRFNERKVIKQVAGENKVDLEDRESGSLVTLAFSLFAIRMAGQAGGAA
jgi:type VI secretion system protein ImpJ